MHQFQLDDQPMSLAQFVKLSDQPVSMTIAPVIRDRLAKGRDIVDRFATSDQPIYGLNTGLGGNLRHRIASQDIADFQAQLLAGRSSGAGPYLPEWVSRAAWLARIVGASRGASGMSLEAFDMMIAMASCGLAPAIPTYGSIGAGDLVLGAHMGETLIGKGHVWNRGTCRPTWQALQAHNLRPIALAPKDALALANHSSLTIALSALALRHARSTMNLAQAVAALSGEGYGMNTGIFEASINSLRLASGQSQAALWFRTALARSSLYDAGEARSIQDALSFRVLAPLFGSARTALHTAEHEVENELNGAADNPAVLVDSGELLSTANFHTPALALALDTLAIAHVHLATASAQRIVKLMNPQLSGLPKYLSPVGGSSAGFMPMQKTVAALLGEIRLQAQPASLEAMPVSEMVEDVAPQTPLAARKLDTQVELLRWLAAIEALVAAQAIDLRKPARLGRVSQLLYDAIRAKVPPLHEDRSSGEDVATTLREISSSDIETRLAEIELTLQ